jgi:hypothetical protein
VALLRISLLLLRPLYSLLFHNQPLQQQVTQHGTR